MALAAACRLACPLRQLPLAATGVPTRPTAASCGQITIAPYYAEGQDQPTSRWESSYYYLDSEDSYLFCFWHTRSGRCWHHLVQTSDFY